MGTHLPAGQAAAEQGFQSTPDFSAACLQAGAGCCHRAPPHHGCTAERKPRCTPFAAYSGRHTSTHLLYMLRLSLRQVSGECVQCRHVDQDCCHAICGSLVHARCREVWQVAAAVCVLREQCGMVGMIKHIRLPDLEPLYMAGSCRMSAVLKPPWNWDR